MDPLANGVIMLPITVRVQKLCQAKWQEISWAPHCSSSESFTKLDARKPRSQPSSFTTTSLPKPQPPIPPWPRSLHLDHTTHFPDGRWYPSKVEKLTHVQSSFRKVWAIKIVKKPKAFSEGQQKLLLGGLGHPLC